MKLSFNRITSSGDFLPEIDGLRFIAIASVVLFHISSFFHKIQDKLFLSRMIPDKIDHVLQHGHIGVPLFFIISGFILALPFGKTYLLNFSPLSIKNYFYRRLIRLEPPYILVLTILLFFGIYNSVNMTFSDKLYSYISSLFYFHNFIINDVPFLNGVTWSLEIEVQFYVIAPFVFLIYKIKNHLLRRFIIILLTLIFLLLNHYIFFKYNNLIVYFQYFLIGIFLADIYLLNSKIFSKTKFDSIIALFLFILIFSYDEHDWENNLFLFKIIQLIAILLFYYFIVIHKALPIFSNKIITNIGGMCYSIYLLHNLIISYIGNKLVRVELFRNVFLLSFLILSSMLIISSIFFLLIERPCMDKNWPTNLKLFLKSKSITLFKK